MNHKEKNKTKKHTKHTRVAYIQAKVCC